MVFSQRRRAAKFEPTDAELNSFKIATPPVTHVNRQHSSNAIESLFRFAADIVNR